MKLKNLRLTLASVNRNPNARDIEAVEVKVNRKRNTDGTLSKEVDCYTIVCVGNKGDTLNVKVPSSLATKVTDLREALDADNVVMVEFSELRLTAYALLNGGTLYSGISGSAQGLSITSKTPADPDDSIMMP